VPAKSCYNRLDRLLKDFIWASDAHKRGFHQVAWDSCCMTRSNGGMGMFNYEKQGIALCAKWVI